MKRVLLLAAMSAIGGNATLLSFAARCIPTARAGNLHSHCASLLLQLDWRVYRRQSRCRLERKRRHFRFLWSTFQQRPTPNFSVVSNSASTMNSQEASWLALRPCSMGFQILETQ